MYFIFTPTFEYFIASYMLCDLLYIFRNILRRYKFCYLVSYGFCTSFDYTCYFYDAVRLPVYCCIYIYIQCLYYHRMMVPSFIYLNKLHITNMSLKVLCFGENQLLKRVISKLRTDTRHNVDEEIVVDNIEIKGKPFLAFSITNPELIGSQATSTSGLLYFLDPSHPLYEQKQFFFNVIGQRKQFENIPAVIVYDKDQSLNIKEIVNQFQLFKVKDRASMIKEVDLADRETIVEIFSWIDSQVEFRKTRTFDAPPKIVKMKPKYRESQPESTEKKYEGIIKEKKFKGIGVKAQQQAYIEMEKERIKNENMEKQLAHFNKNKKKMAPYDIKATPNPKIDANLHFFLKDARVEKAQEVNIKIQTDEFKEKPKQKPYIPKKTGVNTATQIESTQLFDFVKEVQPILDILTTRALESAALQIEQEQEILKISKYKNAYTDRVKKQKKHEQQNIEQELQAIKQKQRILQIARKKDQTKKLTTKKQSYYSIANTFLQNIYKDAAFSLYKKNVYPNEFQHALKTDYLPEILKRSLVSYQKILEKQKCLQNVFEENCVKTLEKEGVALRAKNYEKKKQKEERRINKGEDKRVIHIFYDSPENKKFSSFSKYLGNEIEGNLDQYIKSRQDQIQEAEDKLQAGQMDQSTIQRIKQKDNDNYSNAHNAALISNDKSICFATTQNKYSKPAKMQQFTPGCILFDREGNVSYNGTPYTKGEQFVKGVTDLRYYRDLVNFDSGMIVNLDKLPEKIKSVVFYLEIKNIGLYSTEAQIKNVKNAAYGLEFYKKSIPIFKEDVGTKVEWQQLNKQPQGEGGEGIKQKEEEGLYLWGYHLTRKGKQNWVIEQLNLNSKPVKASNKAEFMQRICSFYKSSLQIFKSEQDEPKPVPKQESKNTKRKSKKNIVQQKQIAPPKIEKLPSRILKEVQVNLHDKWEQVWNKLGDSVVDWKQFIENSPDGWYLEFRGKKLENIQQIKKFNKVGDILLRKVIPVVEQEKPEQPQGQEEAKPEQDE